MRGRSFLVLLAVAAVSGCPWVRDDGTGHFALERTAPGHAHLADLKARARWCSRDSLLTVAATGDDWIAAVGMRTAWPPARRFAVDSLSGAAGTAAVAVRAVGDSIGIAFIAHRGSVEIDSGVTLGGRFTAESGEDSARVGYSGRFEGMRPDTSGCPAAATPGG